MTIAHVESYGILQQNQNRREEKYKIQQQQQNTSVVLCGVEILQVANGKLPEFHRNVLCAKCMRCALNIRCTAREI